MTHKTEWGMRSYQDKPDSTRWGGQNVFHVTRHSKARARRDKVKIGEWRSGDRVIGELSD